MYNMENIKESYKYYKKKQPPPNFDNVLDFNNADQHKGVLQQKLLKPRQSPVAGLQPVEQWKAFQLQSYPGFAFISNPFDAAFQKYWIKRCLCHYPTKPSKTNLDIHMKLTEHDNIWKIGQREGESSGKTVLEKLRWTTLGYHHDWDTKVYSKENYTAFPSDLSYLSTYIAMTLGYPEYKAQAAIINYYHMDSTLGPHNDHSEEDQESPLISVSFGQSAIFLLGGKSKEEPAIPMYIRDGDIMVMYGPCRLNYHAVPRIINPNISPGKLCSQNQGKSEDYNLDKVPARDSGDQKRLLCYNESDSAKSSDQHSYETDKKNRSTTLYNESDSAKSSDQHSYETDKKNHNKVHNITEINDRITATMQETLKEDWTPFHEYLLNGRINMNIRQVYKQEKNKDSDLCTDESKRQKLS